MTTSPARVTYRFGEFEVDMAAFEVRRREHRISLARQPMDLLLLLLEHRQELVSREDMAKRLWGSEVFTDPAAGIHTAILQHRPEMAERLWGSEVFTAPDAGIHTAILKIRQVLGDSRESPRFVETVPGRGYRFIAPVEVVRQFPPQISPALLVAPERLPATRRHNLPAELTSFVGRRKELHALPGMLASSRLLSLTGAGGVGKT